VPLRAQDLIKVNKDLIKVNKDLIKVNKDLIKVNKGLIDIGHVSACRVMVGRAAARADVAILVACRLAHRQAMSAHAIS
jgi:hypothetical protein